MHIAGDTLRFARRIATTALIALVPVLVLLGYIMWRELRGPSPAYLCDRIDQLTHMASSDLLRDQCISTYEGLRDLADGTYRELATCIEQATTGDDVAACWR